VLLVAWSYHENFEELRLRCAGEFNDLSMLPDAVWEQMESARAKK
jgi:hypothetical protein